MFRESDIDAQVLPELSESDFEKLGVSLGHRKRLLKAIANLGATASPTKPANPAPTSTGDAERRRLTVMFIDLVGSTALSARLDPEDMREVIRVYQNTVAGEVTRFEGHIAKYMGDGVLAYFGWPRAHEDEAERSARAGLAVVQAVARLQTLAGETLQTRIGVATGLVVVGDLIGEGAAQEQAVVGDTPNLAARLQGAAEPGMVVIAESTRVLIGNQFVLQDLGALTLKGIAEPTPAFAVLSERPLASRFAAKQSGSLAPIVARDQELALFVERWRRTKTGEGQIGPSRRICVGRERSATPTSCIDNSSV